MHRLLHRHWYHSWNHIKGGGFQKLSHWGRGKGGGGGEVQNFMLEKRIKLKRRSWCRNGGVATFFTTLQFSSIAFTFSDLQTFELAMQDFHPHPSLVLKPGIICIFLICSGSLQKMLTALFNLVRNTQKSIWTIFFWVPRQSVS